VTGAIPPRCPDVVVVMGVAGAGKTTVGLALAAAMGRAFHDADDFHPPANVARMRAGVPLTDADRAPWLAALGELVAACIAAGAPAVLACSALRASYRAALVPPHAPPGAVAFVHLDASPALVAWRLGARQGHFMPAALAASQFAALEEPHDAIRVDAAAPVAEIVARLRERLPC
jgi:gluconokinase